MATERVSEVDQNPFPASEYADRVLAAGGDREIWERVRAGRRRDAEERLRIYLDDSERMVLDVVRNAVAQRPDRTGGRM